MPTAIQIRQQVLSDFAAQCSNQQNCERLVGKTERVKRTGKTERRANAVMIAGNDFCTSFITSEDDDDDDADAAKKKPKMRRRARNASAVAQNSIFSILHFETSSCSLQGQQESLGLNTPSVMPRSRMVCWPTQNPFWRSEVPRNCPNAGCPKCCACEKCKDARDRC